MCDMALNFKGMGMDRLNTGKNRSFKFKDEDVNDVFNVLDRKLLIALRFVGLLGK
mgnify:CR=1 FL=1